MKFKGIKLHQCIKYFSIRSDFFNKVLNFAELHDLPVVIHLKAKKDVLDLIEAVRDRKVKVIVAHLFYIELFHTAWESIKDCIWFDTANYYFLNQSTLEKSVGYFTADKLIFGSDNPFGIDCISKTMSMIDKLHLTDTEKDNISGGTIAGLLHLLH